MRYLSLFSGIEAATQAWQPLGWECVAVSEIEPFPCAVLEHHYPHIPNLGDVTKITEQQIKDLGQIDLIVFGSPCQNLSVAGNRKGFAGEQSSLFYAAMEIINYAKRHCGARFALWENVPGAFSSNRGADFTEVVKYMAGLNELNTPTNGWGKEGAAVGDNGLLEWSVLDAQWFGLAQRRKRVFAIVDFGDWTSRPPILLERESLRGDSAPSRETKQGTAANAQTGFTKQGHGDYRNCGVGSTCTAHQSKDCSGLIVCHGTQDPITNNETAYALGCNSGQENVVALAVSDVCGTLTRSHGDRGVCMDSFASGQCAIGKGYVRRLTPIECEKLQGFPPNFTKIPYRNKSADGCPNGVRYKALGNSMAVNVMAWIGKQIHEAIGWEENMLEKDVKDKVKDIVAAAGKIVPIYTMCPMTFGYGESGHPDRLLYINGHLLGIECKKDGNTSLLRPELKATSSERAQKHRLREITEAGGISIVVHSGNLKQFKTLLEKIINHKISVKV